jgi:hypothetical protein
VRSKEQMAYPSQSREGRRGNGQRGHMWNLDLRWVNSVSTVVPGLSLQVLNTVSSSGFYIERDFSFYILFHSYSFLTLDNWVVGNRFREKNKLRNILSNLVFFVLFLEQHFTLKYSVEKNTGLDRRAFGRSSYIKCSIKSMYPCLYIETQTIRVSPAVTSGLLFRMFQFRLKQD